MIDNSTIAEFLYGGGWRAEDREQMIAVYQLEREDADALCKELSVIDKNNRIVDDVWDMSEDEFKSEVTKILKDTDQFYGEQLCLLYKRIRAAYQEVAWSTH